MGIMTTPRVTVAQRRLAEREARRRRTELVQRLMRMRRSSSTPVPRRV
jgi:hypothetical protein